MCLCDPRTGQYVIYALGEQLQSLDGETIIDGERLMAIRTVKKQEEEDKAKQPQVQKWLAVKDKVRARVQPTRPHAVFLGPFD